MTGNVALSSSQRLNLLSLQDTQSLAERTNIRLATGKKVNQVSDNAVSYFRSLSLSRRADDFTIRQDNINQGIQAINATLNGISAVDSLLQQLRGIAEATRSQLKTERIVATSQFKEIFNQISLLIDDTSYQGLNLLNSTSHQLVVYFGTKTQSLLQINGVTLNAYTANGTNNSLITAPNAGHLFTDFIAYQSDTTGAHLNLIFSRIFTAAVSIGGGAFGPASGFSNIGDNNSNVSSVDKTVIRLDAAIARLRAHASTFGNYSSILTTRQTFTKSYITALRTGSDSLVLADLNEEAATSIVLQTRQSLGINALRLSGQQIQAIVQLIQ